jgi:murein L,D-transpeptidase YafK
MHLLARLLPLVALAALFSWPGPVALADDAPPPAEVSWETITEQGFELVVRKADRRMQVVSPPGEDGKVVRSWRIGLGFTPEGDKQRQGDGKTPEGSFRVTRRIPQSQYYKAFLISYPEVEDADRGEADGIVSKATADSIRSAHSRGRTPDQYTSLGGLIEIHGMGSSMDWTLGCVAADNVVIDELWPHVQAGTKVRILP